MKVRSAARIVAVAGALTLSVAGLYVMPAAADTNTPAEPPANLQTTDVQPESITVAWDAVDRATSYSVRLIALEAFCGAGYQTATTTDLTFTFGQLNWDCPYKITVRSFVPFNYPFSSYSDASAITASTTLPDGYVLPGPPSDLRAIRDAAGVVQELRWDPATTGTGLLTYQLYVDVEGFPELSGPLGSRTAITSRDVRQDFAEFGSILEPGQTLTVRVTTLDRTLAESAPAEPLVFTCCAL